jgi:membrane protease YdiL (CAAX protease family)
MANAVSSSTATPPPTEAGRLRRIVEIVLFVALWMGIGFRFRLDPNAYLLIGIPLTGFFQWAIRRKPIRALWVRSAPIVRWDTRMLIGLIVLLVVPCFGLLHTLRSPSGIDWIRAAWFASAVAGAFAAAYSLRNFTRETLDSLYRCLATAGLYGAIIVLGAAVAIHFPVRSPILMVRVAIESLLAYVPVCYFLEEVTFRGLLDAHVYEPGEKRSILSASFISVLWGIWHLPIAPREGPILLLIARLILVHTLLGVPLSLYWRRSGNLGVPALTHSLVDALRNALLSGFWI